MHFSAVVNTADLFCFFFQLIIKKIEIENYYAVFCKTRTERKSLKIKALTFATTVFSEKTPLFRKIL